MITFACTRSKTGIPSILKYFHVAVHAAYTRRMNLVTCPKVFSSLTPDNNRISLTPQLRPRRGPLVAVTHVTLILTCKVLPMNSSPTVYPAALLCNSECTIHHTFTQPLMLFKARMSPEFPSTSLRKAVGALSLYLTSFSP